jgi:hypothetical protein
MLAFPFLSFLSFPYSCQPPGDPAHVHDQNSTLLRLPRDDDSFCALRPSADYARLAKQCRREHCTVVACTNPENVTDTPAEFECAKDYCDRICAEEPQLDGCPARSTDIAFIILGVILLLSVCASIVMTYFFRKKRPPEMPEVPTQNVRYPARVPPRAARRQNDRYRDLVYPSPPMYGYASAVYQSGDGSGYQTPEGYGPPLYPSLPDKLYPAGDQYRIPLDPSAEGSGYPQSERYGSDGYASREENAYPIPERYGPDVYASVEGTPDGYPDYQA